MSDSNLETFAKVGEPNTARALPRRSPHLDREFQGATETAGEEGAPPPSRSRWRRPLLALGPVALVVGALALYLMTGRYVSEEDAYVQAVSASVSPQISGQVMGIEAKSNAQVKKDNLLFVIDSEPYRIALANAEAQLGIARDQAHTLIETYRARQKQIDEARATVDYTQANYERQQQLYNTGTVPRATLDAAIRDFQAAKANLASLEREAAAALAQIGGNLDLPVDQQSAVKQAQAAVDLAARNLRLTSVVAPFDGTPHNVESIATGVFLNAGQSAFPLVSARDLYIEANIKETDLTYVREGNSARAIVDAYPDTPIAARVTSLAPASGSVFALLPPQNATGNWVKVVQRIPVRLFFDQPANHPPLRAGMSVKISIDTGHQRSLRELWRDLTAIFGA
jgi:membrane fusion protein (multidrug efflux system)